ncbi:uncharacterized protein LOC141665931 [Apium graveolens]|uniref:uncharacterized protein LOC141665931 n=1 Tax=Apium graveolens TaxID=4045 RepID=UPI003D7AF08A
MVFAPATDQEIHKLLKSIGKSFKDFDQMPQPPDTYLDFSDNNLIIEERSYDIAEMEKEYAELISNCNAEQLTVFNTVMESVRNKKGGLFFVYGSGGCGKTYLWRTIISKLRSERQIVLPVASSGIAATLMPGGRTVHSRFKIPIVLDDVSMCAITHQSDMDQLIKSTSLIIWDEVPMQHRYSFECLDRSLRDIMKAVHPDRFHMPFGGITVVLGGDFRQILPVIPQGTRGQIVSPCITKSKLWKFSIVFKLIHSMYITKERTESEIQSLKNFAKWVPDIGDGKVPSTHVEDDICISEEYCNLQGTNCVEEMIESTFPDFKKNFQDLDYLSERAILSPTNQTVGHVNSAIVETIPGEMYSYFNVDTTEDFPGSQRDQMQSFPPETRMIVTKCLKHCVQCEICYAMTINKFQGQSLQKVGLYLSKGVFTYGQVYVAVSRVTSPQGLRFFINDEMGNPTHVTQNIAYKEVFYNVQNISMSANSERIHAFISPQIGEKFEKDFIECLVYTVKNFKIKLYNGDETNRPIRTDKHIYFTNDTVLKKDETSGLTVPHNVINMTFFNEFGNSFLNAMEKVVDKTNIITICYAKVSDWKGYLYLTNFPSTRFYLNADHYNVSILRKRF